MRAVILMISVLVSSVSLPSWAGTELHGGDPIELQFQEVATNIGQWIESGNADALEMPDAISLDAYKQRMLRTLEGYRISFTEDSVVVEGAQKVCQNSGPSSQPGKILCNRKAFVALKSDSAQLYQLVHHEIAGLSGIELGLGANSDYFISRQISDYLRDEVVKRLPVLPISVQPCFNILTYTHNGQTERRITKYNCTAQSVVIPEGITQIGKAAFAGKRINDIYFPQSLEVIGDSAFENNQVVLLQIPEGIKKIGENAFRKNEIVVLELPESLTDLGSYAFYRNQLTSMKVPGGLRVIRDGVFAQNPLDSVEIPRTVKFIGSDSFRKSQLDSVEISKDTQIIEYPGNAPHREGNSFDKRVRINRY